MYFIVHLASKTHAPNERASDAVRMKLRHRPPTPMRPRALWPEFGGTNLEDSFLLGVVAHGRDLRFKNLFSLTTEHPEYEPPRPGEQHCYREGYLTVAQPTVVEWVAGSPRLSMDPDGSFDLGGIELYRCGATRFRIITEWFDATVETGLVAVELRDTEVR